MGLSCEGGYSRQFLCVVRSSCFSSLLLPAFRSVIDRLGPFPAPPRVSRHRFLVTHAWLSRPSNRTMEWENDGRVIEVGEAVNMQFIASD